MTSTAHTEISRSGISELYPPVGQLAVASAEAEAAAARGTTRAGTLRDRADAICVVFLLERSDLSHIYMEAESSRPAKTHAMKTLEMYILKNT